MLRDDPHFLILGAEPGRRTWRGLGLLALVFGGSLLFAAILAPPVHGGVRWLAASTDAPLWDYLARHPFTRYFDRLRWLPVLLALPWLLRTCGLWSFAALGYRRPSGPAWAAFGAGIAMMCLLALAQAVALGARPTFPALAALPGLLAGALASGLLIALLEETVFRGLVQRLFLATLRPWPALLGSSFLFAILHFKKIPASIWPPDTAIHAGSGFLVAFWTLASAVVTFDLVYFANYFLAGLLLALVFHRTRSLWPCVGLHAGWVAFRAVYEDIVVLPASQPHLLFGSTRLIDGLLPAAILALACALVAGRGRQPAP